MGKPYKVSPSLKAASSDGRKSSGRVEDWTRKSLRGRRILRLARNGLKYRISR
ncbi:hypothetical protein D3C78_1826830 [compost metagenome]